MLGIIFVAAILGTVMHFISVAEQKKQEEIEQQKRAEQRHREEIARRLATKKYFEQNPEQLNSGYRGYSQNPYLYTSGSWYKGWQNH